MIRITTTLLAITVALSTLPALGRVSDDDIDRAREEVNQILAESQELGDRIQRAWAHQSELEYEIEGLVSSIELAEIRLADTWRRLEEVAVELYMGTTSGTSIGLMFRTSSDVYEAGLEYLRNVSGADENVINELRILTRELDRQRDRWEEASAEHEILTAELVEMATQLQDELVAAQVVYDDLVAQQAREAELARQEELRRQEAERRARQAAIQATSTTSTTTTTAAVAVTTTSSTTSSTTTTVPASTTTTEPSAPPSSGGGTCPVAGAVTFTDTWGHPRSGGRTHQGVDMIAARGTPIVAVYAGTIKRISESPLGGKSVWLRAHNGDEFFYGHLDGYGAISTGQPVDEGYVIGYNGSTGNAPSWLPHLHFEYHPGGGSAVNPYPLAKTLCG